MDAVGLFLQHLFDDGKVELPKCLLPQRCDPKLSHQIRSSSTSGMPEVEESPHFLHEAPGYNQNQLIMLIVEIYGGPPEAFEVLHCRPTTSEQDLKLFIKRISKHPHQKYLILEVNSLPYELQEVQMAIKLYYFTNKMKCLQFK